MMRIGVSRPWPWPGQHFLFLSFFSPAAAPGGTIREEPGPARALEPLASQEGLQLFSASHKLSVATIPE